MDKPLDIQGRQLSSGDLDQIRNLISENPDWHRTRLSRELCGIWNWRRPNGGLKDMACRELLRKLESRRLLTLPEARHEGHRKRKIHPIEHDRQPIDVRLPDLIPLRTEEVSSDSDGSALFSYLVKEYHYLGYESPVGENMKYLVRSRDGRLIGCLLFGSASWKVEARDRTVGWNLESRKRNLLFLTNNTRFLILPWVTVKNLASHILSLVLNRLNHDWRKKYHHDILSVETYVDSSRFRGTCYQAANWQFVGQTKGRSRQDRHRNLNVPVKDIYLYPLHRNWKTLLQDSSPAVRFSGRSRNETGDDPERQAKNAGGKDTGNIEKLL
jgi:hypothetical protein